MRTIVLVLLATWMAPRISHADSAAAKEHYKKGVAYFALQKYKEAAAEYELGFEAEPDPALLYNAAQAHRLAGNNRRALALYQNFVRMFPDRDDGSAQRHIEALKVAIEAESKAEHQPPTDTREPTTTTTPETKPAVVETKPAVTLTAPPPPPPKKRTPKWVWGVAAGGAAVLAIGLGVGLGVGLSGTQYPSTTVGSAHVP